MFANKKIEKTYYAVAIGEMNEEGEMIAAIDGKRSHSIYKRHKSVPSKRFGELNLLELKPQTGRRHQLRKHLSGIGNPILGDKDYGIEGLILHGKGMYLHAHSLSFIHPFSGERMVLEDELPVRFGKLFFL